MKQIAVIGGGKMGEALVSGWIASASKPADQLGPGSFQIAEPGRERRAMLNQKLGATCVESVGLIERADMVVLAVKPQVMTGVLQEVSGNAALCGDEGPLPLFVSIAAGLATSTLEAGLPENARVVRVMPNMPLAVGAGASGVCAGSRATAKDSAYVAELFGCLGRAVVVDEEQMDVVCALSGSGPAYVAAMIEALRDAAADQGLDAQLAETLALQTVLGTAQLIAQTGASVQATRESICSPGGTTIAALEAMHAEGFDAVFAAGVKAAVQRSKELARC